MCERFAATVCLLVWLVRWLIHRAERGRRHGVSVLSPLVVEDEVVPCFVPSHAFFRLDGPVVIRYFGPYWCDLAVETQTLGAIGTGECVTIHRVHIPTIVYDPIAGLAGLPTAPLAIGETWGIEVQLDRHDQIARALDVFPSCGHGVVSATSADRTAQVNGLEARAPRQAKLLEPIVQVPLI